MARQVTVGDLEIDQDLGFQRAEWRALRFAWALLGLFLIAALLGLMGGYGPLRVGEADAPGEPLTVEYDRFMRLRAPSELRFTFAPGAAQAGEVKLALSSAYTRELDIRAITPEPDAVEAAAGRTVYTFAAAEADASLTVLFRIGIARVGVVTGRAGSGDALPVVFSHFVYP